MQKGNKNIKAIIIILVVFASIILSGCVQDKTTTMGPAKNTSGLETENPQMQLSDLIGSWRIYSSRIYYDVGGGGTVDTTATQILELKASSKYDFGSSGGTWSVESFSPDDWKRWGIEPYGHTRKILLSGWNGGIADGPIEESTRVDFIWVIYKVKPPIVSAPGTAWMKFGRIAP
jgi:hypothetical protein